MTNIIDILSNNSNGELSGKAKLYWLNMWHMFGIFGRLLCL